MSETGQEKNEVPINFGELSGDQTVVQADQVTEKDILQLAKNSLIFIGVVFFILVLYRIIGPYIICNHSCYPEAKESIENIKETFSTIVQIISPIGTLILGYYFSSAKK